MSILKWIVGVPLVVLAIAFAVANGEHVTFTYSPIHAPINWPLYALVLCALVLGFVIGSFMTWAAGYQGRADKRALARQNKELQKELDHCKAAQVKEDTLQIARRNLSEEELY